MSRHRDFDAARAEHAGEALTFRLAGRDFTTVPQIPAGVLLDLASYEDRPLDGFAFQLFGRFLRSIVVPEQQGAMREAMDEVGLDVVFDIVNWVIGEVTARPLPNASPSDGSPSPTGEPLRVAWSSPAEEALSV